MIRVGVVGASGYMGGEALRILLNHPQVDLAWVTSRSTGAIDNYHPNLYEAGIELIQQDQITPCDVAFVALPTAASLEIIPQLIDMGIKVIDLGAAFRLKDKAVWEKIYQQKHEQWDLMDHAVYGINELYDADIEKAQLVANPGCFSSAAILGLAPLLAENLIDPQKIMVNGLSGSAGVGAELSRPAHHPELANNLVPYNVVDHRHSYEMEQELSILASAPVSVHFTPTYVPITRGILNVCSVFPHEFISRKQLLDKYREYYRISPFVKIYDLPEDENDSWQYRAYPWVSAVAGTNNCYIGLDVDERRGRIVVFSVLDSLGKGGAQVGIENMNIMFGFERTEGLVRFGMHPN